MSALMPSLPNTTALFVRRLLSWTQPVDASKLQEAVYLLPSELSEKLPPWETMTDPGGIGISTVPPQPVKPEVILLEATLIEQGLPSDDIENATQALDDVLTAMDTFVTQNPYAVQGSKYTLQDKKDDPSFVTESALSIAHNTAVTKGLNIFVMHCENYYVTGELDVEKALRSSLNTYLHSTGVLKVISSAQQLMAKDIGAIFSQAESPMDLINGLAGTTGNITGILDVVNGYFPIPGYAAAAAATAKAYNLMIQLNAGVAALSSATSVMDAFSTGKDMATVLASALGMTDVLEKIEKVNSVINTATNLLNLYNTNNIHGLTTAILSEMGKYGLGDFSKLLAFVQSLPTGLFNTLPAILMDPSSTYSGVATAVMKDVGAAFGINIGVYLDATSDGHLDKKEVAKITKEIVNIVKEPGVRISTPKTIALNNVLDYVIAQNRVQKVQQMDRQPMYEAAQKESEDWQEQSETFETTVQKQVAYGPLII
jgi:hypothetical protein